jgi:MoaA/NifB/PqqE/SkfB family radical SAM enzyme
MNNIDLIIDALQNCSAFQPKNYYEIDKALAAARELKSDALKVIEAQSKQSNEFYPDWDMIKPYHERIKELEAQLAKCEWVGLTDDEKESLYKHADAENYQFSKLVGAVEWLLKNKNTTIKTKD